MVVYTGTVYNVAEHRLNLCENPLTIKIVRHKRKKNIVMTEGKTNN